MEGPYAIEQEQCKEGRLGCVSLFHTLTLRAYRRSPTPNSSSATDVPIIAWTVTGIQDDFSTELLTLRRSLAGNSGRLIWIILQQTQGQRFPVVQVYRDVLMFTSCDAMGIVC